MSIKKIYTGLLIISLLSERGFAQQNIKLESLIPPAPNAAELGKYSAIPVGTLTGVPDISFSLYQVESGQLKLPITLSYHASGVQVNQKSTDVGLGWSIMAGGQISRTVYGTADDKPNGYFNDNYNPPSFSYLQNITDYYQLQEYSLNPSYDLEPDLFFYNLSGRSGKFIYTKNKTFQTIPFEPLKIQKMLDGQGKLIFQITDDNGIIYQFNKYSQTVTDHFWPPKIWQTLNSWYLTAMISADFTDTISFTYENYAIEDAIEQHIYTLGQDKVNIISNVGQLQKSTSTLNYNEQLIKQIRFKNGYVQFNRNTIRKDASVAGYALDEMLVYNSNNYIVKKVVFNHGYFNAEPFYDSWQYYRLKLTGFIESDASSIIKKEFKFDYNNTALPPYYSYNIDYWGFYNGQNNVQSLIPVTTVDGYDMRAVTFSDGATYSFGSFDETNTWTFGHANREPSEANMKAAILTKITYPTGGYNLFDYEPHKYLSDDYVKQSISKGGLTRGIDRYTKSENVYNFTNPTDLGLQIINRTIGADLNINFSASNMNNTIIDETQVVTLTDLTTNTSRIWKHEGDLTIAQTVNLKTLLVVGHSYSLKCTVYGDNSVTINTTLSWTENTSQHQIKIGGGLRVASIKSYTQESSLATQEHYSYGINENGLGVKLFDERKFYRNYEDVVLEYFLTVGPESHNCGEEGEYLQKRYLGISKYNSLNYLGSPVLYSSVTKFEGTPILNTGKTIYFYNILQETTSVPIDFINSGNYGSINNVWNQGEVDSIIRFRFENGQYVPVHKTLYEYGKFNQITENAIQFKQYKQVIKLDDCLMVSPPGLPSEGPGLKHFIMFQYPIKSGGSRKTKETKIVFDQNDPTKTVYTVTNYQYANPEHLYPTELSFIKSDGNQRITRIKYPQDFSDAVTPVMVSKNIISPIIEEKSIKSVNNVESVLSTTQTQYAQIGNLIKPSMIKTATGLNNLENRIRFIAYDNSGNLLEQQKENDVKHSYIWGYNGAYPVAEIIGVDHNTVIATQGFNQTVVQSIATSDVDMRTELNKIRSAYPSALVTTYTYKPLVGISSATDPNGRTTYYEYDNFGRLSLVRDKDNKILKKFCYNYQGQQEQCNFYESAAINQYYYSQNCGSQTPVAYYVSVPQGMFTSSSSQPDADAQAQAYAQAQANQYGTCQQASITLNYSNNTGTDFMIDLYNTSTGEEFWLDAYSYSSGILGDVPEGTYNISITPYDYYGYYSYSVGCGYYNSGYNQVSFYDVPLNSYCNNISMYY